MLKLLGHDLDKYGSQHESGAKRDKVFEEALSKTVRPDLISTNPPSRFCARSEQNQTGEGLQIPRDQDSLVLGKAKALSMKHGASIYITRFATAYSRRFQRRARVVIAGDPWSEAGGQEANINIAAGAIEALKKPRKIRSFLLTAKFEGA